MDRKRCPATANKRRRRGRTSSSSISILESMFAPNTTDDTIAAASTSANALATGSKSFAVKKSRHRLLVKADTVASRSRSSSIAIQKRDRAKDESSSCSSSVESSADEAEDPPTSRKMRKPGAAKTTNVTTSKNDSSSEDEDADPEQMMKDWEVYDDLTTKERKQLAVSHGFATIGGFRKFMTMQQLAFTRSFKKVDASDLKFAWQTWALNSTLQKIRIAADYGYASIPEFEEFISVQQAQAVSLMEPDPDP